MLNRKIILYFGKIQSICVLCFSKNICFIFHLFLVELHKNELYVTRQLHLLIKICSKVFFDLNSLLYIFNMLYI